MATESLPPLARPDDSTLRPHPAMTAVAPARPLVDDHWVAHPAGRLFARSWTPAGAAHPATAAASSKPATPLAPIVLFHDSLGSVELWRDFPAELCAATGRRVVAYDRLGFGRSDARTGTLAMDFIGDEARTFFPAVRQALGIEDFVAFGHSVGGGMAVYCAAACAADCAALITIAAQAFPEERTLLGVREAKTQFAGDGQVERLARYHGDKARWVLDAWTETWLHPEFASWSLAEVLPRVSCPVLVIHGEHDEYGSTSHPEMIGHLSAGQARVEIIPDARHVPHRENPDQIVALVASFLSGRQSDPAA